jgi:hypothetical protein
VISLRVNVDAEVFITCGDGHECDARRKLDPVFFFSRYLHPTRLVGDVPAYTTAVPDRQGGWLYGTVASA